MTTLFRLSISCPDRSGIVAAVTGFLLKFDANILSLEQHSTGDDGEHFYMRVEFETNHAQPGEYFHSLETAFTRQVAEKFSMHWRLSDTSQLPKIAIFASKTDHCLLELLWRAQRGELPCEVALVISNHNDLRKAVENFGVRFEYLPIDTTSKQQVEQQQQALCADCDLIVLARYMQILSPDLVAQWQRRIINIHHSFLPAFIGANPYQQAWNRGVKLIGATAHYVTDELDEGPIIQQAVAQVSHRDSVEDLRHLGQELERKALYQAVRWHLEERVVVHGKRTVVFH